MSSKSVPKSKYLLAETRACCIYDLHIMVGGLTSATAGRSFSEGRPQGTPPQRGRCRYTEHFAYSLCLPDPSLPQQDLSQRYHNCPIRGEVSSLLLCIRDLMLTNWRVHREMSASIFLRHRCFPRLETSCRRTLMRLQYPEYQALYVIAITMALVLARRRAPVLQAGDRNVFSVLPDWFKLITPNLVWAR